MVPNLSKVFVLTMALSLAATACGGATKYTTVGVGAAQGADVQIEVDENDGNYELELQVQNLLPPWVRCGGCAVLRDLGSGWRSPGSSSRQLEVR
jgi:hypothetical protein